MRPKACILRTAGTNCERELAYAFTKAGAQADVVHVNALRRGYDPITQRSVSMDEYQIMGLPGGFSHGDYLGAGRVLAHELKDALGDAVQRLINKDGLVIGICNGFQALIKAGILPYNDGKQHATLTYNEQGRFEDRWVRLRTENLTSVWTRGMAYVELPVAHGEGRFVAEQETLDALQDDGQVAFQYVDGQFKPSMDFPENPNGSLEAIAGITDPSGRILGLMPHPERFHTAANHPGFTRHRILHRDYARSEEQRSEDLQKVLFGDDTDVDRPLAEDGGGMQMFRDAVDYFR